MIENIINALKDKSILILGFGREGISSYQFIRKYLPNTPLTIADQNTDLLADHPELKSDQHLDLMLGPDYLSQLNHFDTIIKTPGISLRDLDLDSLRPHITSQLELFLTFSPVPVIGVTGTKGKSTTASLIHHIINHQGKKSILLGNIGTPIFDGLAETTSADYVVVEMSSHQLEFVTHSPHIAVITNLYPEHLDHYNGFEGYMDAKLNIARFQNSTDYLIYNTEIPELLAAVTSFKAQKLGINKDIITTLHSIPTKLPGDYNLYNIAYALTVAGVLGLDQEAARTSISDFQPLRHRLELVATVKDIKYYDNSIGTIPAATISAIEALGDVDTLIFGGADRELDMSSFIHYLEASPIRNLICMPETGHFIADNLDREGVYKVETLEEAVSLAKELTRPGTSCLLSPAAASYNQFKNFEEKGNKFAELVKN